MLIQNRKHLASFIGNIQDLYAQLCNRLYLLVKSQGIPLVGSLIEAKPRNQVRKEIEEHLEQLRQISTKEDLELNIHNMQN